MVIGKVQHIPTVNDSTTLAGNDAVSVGLLVDYESYHLAALHTAQDSTPINYVWLRTQNDASSLATVRRALMSQQALLAPVYDRRTLLTHSRST